GGPDDVRGPRPSRSPSARASHLSIAGRGRRDRSIRREAWIGRRWGTLSSPTHAVWASTDGMLRMRVLVAGASGFVGSRLAEVLVEQGHDVRALTRRPEEYRGAGTPVAGAVE